MRILIAGCGYVGSALGLTLASEGHHVFGLRRNPSRLPSGIKPIAADLSGEIPSEDLPADLDFVFYTASAGGSKDEAYKAAYVDGPGNIIQALNSRGEGLKRFFFVSSTGVYGQTGGEWVDESSETEPGNFSGRRLLEGERLVTQSSVPATVVRLAGIYGPGRTRSIERALQAPKDAEPAVYTNRIHRDDCAGALRHLMQLREPEELYLGVDSEPMDRRTVADWLQPRLAGPLPASSSIASAQRRRTNKRCSNFRLLDSGYEFLYPSFREGFGELLGEVA
jgi:nucleoside-diphosphate-sugar epimerase